MAKVGLYGHNVWNETAVYSPRLVEIISAFWLCVILIVGTLINGLTVYVFVRNKHLITNNNVYVLALVFHDLGLSCLATEMPIVAEVCGHWLYIMTMEACVFEAFLVYFVGLASMFILVAMAMSRYVAITRPFLATKLTKIHSIVVVCLCDIFALCFALPPLFGWGSYGLEAHGTSCGLAWRDTTDSFLSYLITITIVCLAIPLIAMIFCYARIYITVRQTGTNFAPGTANTNTSRISKERALLKLSIAFVLSFLISWTPYTIVSFYVAYGKPENIDPLLSRSAALVAKSQVLWNPILYIGLTDSFRKTVLEIFRCRNRNRQRDRERERESASSFYIRDRPDTEQTVTKTIQRMFTASRLSAISASLKVLKRSPRLLGRKKMNSVKIRNNIPSISGCTLQVAGGEEATSSSRNTGLQAEIYSDLVGTSSIIEVIPETSKGSSKTSSDSLRYLPARMKTKRTLSDKIDDDSFENNASTDTVHRLVAKNSHKLLRTQEQEMSFCGDVELHDLENCRKGDDVVMNSVKTSPSTMSKSYGIVINVLDVNNELIPVD